MDPDGCRLVISLLSTALTAVFALYSGMSIEESSREEETDTGLGVSYGTLSSFILTGVMVCTSSATFIGIMSHIFTETWKAVLCSVAFIILLAALFLILPIFLGIAKSEEFKKKLSFLNGIIKVFSLPVVILAFPAHLILKSIGAEKELTEITEEDVIEMVETVEDDVIDAEQKEMINNIFELDDMDCGDIAVHRTEVVAVSDEASVSEVIRTAVGSGFSRIPVYSGTLDNIIGVYLVKDLLPYLLEENTDPDLRKILRKVTYVPTTYKCTQLMRDLRQKKGHLAVVIDEYGGTEGIITLEDILESIVGDIEDEFDKTEETIHVIDEKCIICDGYTEISDVYEALRVEQPDEADEEYDTIGGLVTDLLGYIPEEDEHPACTFGSLRFTVLSTDERRITSVKVEEYMLTEE